jgi:hypothetical protein
MMELLTIKQEVMGSKTSADLMRMENLEADWFVDDALALKKRCVAGHTVAILRSFVSAYLYMK